MGNAEGEANAATAVRIKMPFVNALLFQTRPIQESHGSNVQNDTNASSMTTGFTLALPQWSGLEKLISQNQSEAATATESWSSKKKKKKVISSEQSLKESGVEESELDEKCGVTSGVKTNPRWLYTLLTVALVKY